MEKLNWFQYEGSKKLEEQVKYNIACNCEMGIYACSDGCNEQMSVEEWIEYIYQYLQEEYSGKDYDSINPSAAKHMRFYGKEKTIELIKYYLANYEDVQPYIAY